MDKKNSIILDRTVWLKHGFILQTSKTDYYLGQGPFSYREKPVVQALYHPDFFLTTKKPWLVPSVFCKLNREDFKSFLFEKNKFIESNCGQNFFKNSKKPSFVNYQQIFCQIQQKIQKGTFNKIVPVFPEYFYYKPSLLLFIQNLFSKTKSFSHGYLYGAWDKETGILGFTPEILFSLKGDQISTMALAGTTLYPGSFLLKDEKELKEHAFVVQSIEESLKDIVFWKKKTRSEIVFPPLKHLHTKLIGNLNQKFDFKKICDSLHPTAALGGYPKKPSFEWLKKQYFQNQRAGFGAPFGFYKGEDEAFCLVALRALQWQLQSSQIFSGGGLIKESCLQKEWHELFLKREQVKDFFNLFYS